MSTVICFLLEIGAGLALPERAANVRLRPDVFMAGLRAPYFVNVVFAAEVTTGVATAGMLG